MPELTLETQRLVLRPPQAKDVDVWSAFFLSERAVFVGGGPSRGKDLAWRVFATFAGHWTLRGHGPFIMTVKEDGRAIGSVGSWYPVGWPEPELTWSIWTAGDEGQGFVAEGMDAVLRFVRSDLNWSTAVSYVAPGNEKSAQVATRLGGRIDEDAATPDEDPTVVYRYDLL